MPKSPSLKQRINAGEIITIASVSMDATPEELERVAAECDMFSVDSQHSALSEEKLVAFCAGAEVVDMPVQFRIQHTRHAYLIGRYLDLGVTAIMVPEVREEATVDEAMRFFYYPQKGKRSWGARRVEALPSVRTASNTPHGGTTTACCASSSNRSMPW